MKRDKSPKAQKVLKWHGDEEQMNIYVTICYNPVVSNLSAT